MNALEFFRRGYDTKEIANLLRVDEQEIYNEIHRLREDERKPPAERGLARFNMPTDKPKRGPVRFAGFDPAERL